MALGYLGYRALKSLDDHPLELLITLAVVDGTAIALAARTERFPRRACVSWAATFPAIALR